MVMGTASTMALCVEALGMSLPRRRRFLRCTPTGCECAKRPARRGRACGKRPEADEIMTADAFETR